MKKDTIVCFLLASCMLLCSQMQLASALCPQMRLSVRIQGTSNYTVHDELVKIRHYDNVTSTVIVENRTDNSSIAHFSLCPGRYWVDVRNAWVPVTVSGNQTFVFPYPLYKNASNESDTNWGSFPDLPIPMAMFGGIVVFGIVFLVIAGIFVKRNRKRDQQKSGNEPKP